MLNVTFVVPKEAREALMKVAEWGKDFDARVLLWGDSVEVNVTLSASNAMEAVEKLRLLRDKGLEGLVQGVEWREDI